MLLNRLTITRKIYLLMAGFSIAIIGYGLRSYSTLEIAKVNGPFYQRIVQGKDLIADILPPPEYIIESYLMVLHLANEVDEQASKETIASLVERGDQLKAEYDQRHVVWVQELEPGPMKEELVAASFDPAVEFYRIRDQQFVPACLAGDAETAKELARGPLRQNYETHRAAIDKVVRMATQRNANDELEAAATIRSRTSWSIGWIAIIVGVMTTVGWRIARATVGPLRTSAAGLRSLADQDLAAANHRIQTNARNATNLAAQATSAAEQVHATANSLSTSVEQFESSIREIAGNASAAAGVAEAAVDAATTDQCNDQETW